MLMLDDNGGAGSWICFDLKVGLGDRQEGRVAGIEEHGGFERELDGLTGISRIFSAASVAESRLI
jgi:hypothetical protein